MTRHHSNGKVTSENGNVSAAIHENLDKISGFAKREEAELTSLQRSIERISLSFSEPRFLLTFICACVAWIVSDLVAHRMGYAYFDAPPFSMLQGIVTFIGVLVTMAVLVRQNRLARAEDDRAHLELQVNLLAEQKVTQIIMLLEELRRDLPGVPNRIDERTETLQDITNPDAVLDAIAQRKSKDTNGMAQGKAE
ncbi:hypothetical protein AWB80_07649 [Caballeronia pedi]|uniref:DUF1003 domain-containing protein n=1 Tax=Caballeronia pedi TaxID=1777141 RepID=A0A158DXQ0_9BURK|nr:DUF1003 domain-containing protein [Caballeronia pedi]SAK99334.1 hypothetical protein AWB80_07649 [Caballeronia pedi]